MGETSMEGDVVAWMRAQLQEAHPDLLREMLPRFVQELIWRRGHQDPAP